MNAIAELGANIKANGLQVDIVLFLEGAKTLLLDGVSRLDAIEASGINLVKDGKLDRTLGLGGGNRVRVVADVDPYELAASLNEHRRQLTAEQQRKLAEQKRQRIEAMIAAHPEKSDRLLAEDLKVEYGEKTSDKAVGRARKRLEATATVSQLKKRVGADGKARKKPSKPTKTSAPSVAAQPQPQDERLIREGEAAVDLYVKDLHSAEERFAQLREANHRLETMNGALQAELKDERKSRQAAEQKLRELEAVPDEISLAGAIETLIREAHAGDFLAALPEDVVFAKADLDLVVGKLRLLNGGAMARRRTEKKQADTSKKRKAALGDPAPATTTTTNS
jgi:hypothetical protein